MLCSALAGSMGRGAYHRNGVGPGETSPRVVGYLIVTVVVLLQATIALLPSLVQWIWLGRGMLSTGGSPKRTNLMPQSSSSFFPVRVRGIARTGREKPALGGLREPRRRTDEARQGLGADLDVIH